MSVKQLGEDGLLAGELASAGIHLVVVDFTATWCGPCQQIAPVFSQMAKKYPKAVFLKVDVDQCSETALTYGVRAMPTFLFFRNRNRIDTLQGANSQALEDKIKQHYGSTEEGEGAEDCDVAGHVDLSSYLQLSECECLNEADDHTLPAALKSGAGYLESDCDEQLIISATFNQPVKVHSLKVKCDAKNGPKRLRLFINQPHTIDFDKAETAEAVQEVELTSEQLDGKPVPLRYVKFQNVKNLQVFVRDNQSGDETTRIDRLSIIGSLLASVNMEEFKRVAGKKGEAH